MSIGRTSPTETGSSSGSSTGGRTTRNSRRSANTAPIMSSNDTATNNNNANADNVDNNGNAVKKSTQQQQQQLKQKTTMIQKETKNAVNNAANSNTTAILQQHGKRVQKSFIIFTSVILSLLLVIIGCHHLIIYDAKSSSNGKLFSLEKIWDNLSAVLKINNGGDSSIVDINDSENKISESNNEAKPPSQKQQQQQQQQQHNNNNPNNNVAVVQSVVQSSIKKHKNAARGVHGTVMKEMLRGYPLNIYLDEDLGFYMDDEEEESSSSDDDADDDGVDDVLSDVDYGDEFDVGGDDYEEEERLDGVHDSSDEEGDDTTNNKLLKKLEKEETNVVGGSVSATLLEDEEAEDDEGELSLKETQQQLKKSDKNKKKKDEQDDEDSSDDDEEEEEEEFYDVKAAARAAKRYAVQFGTSSSSSTKLSSSSSNNSTTPLERAMQQAKNVMAIMNKKNDEKNHARVWESGDLAVLKIRLAEDDDESGGEVVEIEGDDSDDDDSEDREDDDVNNEIEETIEEEETVSGGRKKKKKLFDAFKKKRRKLKGQLAHEEESSNDDDDDEDEEEGESDDHEEEEEDSSDDIKEGDEEESSSDDDSESTAAMKTLKQRMLKQNAITADTKNELTLPNLGKQTPEEAAHTILSSSNGITSNLQDRLSTMFAKAKTHECRAKIAEHFALFVNGLAMETKFPFQDWYYPNTCTAIPYYDNWDDLPPDVNLHELHHRVYQPPKDTVPEGTYIENVYDLELAYVILTHDQPESTIRLIESVYVENRTKFVVHVDGKEQADETYARLVEYAQEKNLEYQHEGGEGEYIRIVPNANRVRVNWGGFSMVNATLMAMQTLFGLDYYAEHPEEKVPPGHDNPHAFPFHKMIHLASTTYPLASNTEIRDTLASYPLDANFLHILLQPGDPTPQVWNYFVECDDALHRIYRLPPLTADKGHGIDVYTSSQWFIISREFAWYLAKPPKNSLAEYFREYAEHVVVADESYFGTVLRNTHFCSTLHNDNFLHIQFGSWENESKEASKRDPRKCVMRNPDHCGRSPTTMTLDYLPVLELSGDLFARKFDDVAEPLVKDYIDKRRAKEEERFIREEALAKEIDANKTAGVEVTKKLPLEEWEFEGEGVMLVAKETVSDEVPLCLGLTRHGANRVHLLPCFKEDVPPTLDPDWYTGAVIIEEIEHYNRWDLGPCSSDGELKRNETTGELEMTPGDYSQTGPKCMVKVGDSIRKGRCLDAESDRTKPGSFLNIFPCEAKWHQLFSFGNGDLIPSGAIHLSLPKHLATKDSTTHLCIGVQGRSDEDEVEWLRPEHDDDPDGLWPWEYSNATEYYENGYKSLKYWDGIHLQTTPCSNEGAVIEFFYVPFIVEEYEDDGEAANTVDYSAESAPVIGEKKGAEEGVVGDEL